MKEVLMVGIGGAIGSMLRYGAGFISFGTDKIPVTTLAVNLIGSFLIGILSAYFLKNTSSTYQLLLVTGFCGGFTTFSTFSLHLIKLIQDGSPGYAIVYTLVSVLGGIMLCLVGLFLGEKLLPS